MVKLLPRARTRNQVDRWELAPSASSLAGHDSTSTAHAALVVEADGLAAGDLRVVARVELARTLARGGRLEARRRAREALDLARESATRRLEVETLRLWESLHAGRDAP